ncbi:MAG: leucine-rich repeat protein [Bacteroidota bacterium]|nr:leucine-rich repeat protein [Bacteroidota bacterium]
MRKLLLFFVLILSSLQAWAYDFISGDLAYSITSSSYPYEVSVANRDLPYWGDVTIPSSVTYNGITYSVTSIGQSVFYESYHLTSVTIPSTVISIGEHAFHSCYSLTSINIPSSVKTLEAGCFYACVNLNSVDIPSSVTHIGDLAFMKCYGLTSITIPSSVTYIGATAFDECISLTSVVIPSSITTLTHSVFADCSSLASVTIPSSVTSIETAAFWGCRSLTSIAIPSSVTSIGEFAFAQCTGLRSVTIPSSITTIEADAFFFCTGLKTVTIPSSITSIGNFAFGSCYSLASIEIPSSVTSIGSEAFNNCRSLIYVDIPLSVRSIGESAFEGCASLTSINIPSSVTSIGQYAFQYCSNLISVTIPSSITTIENGTFYNCTGLTSVTIPSSISTIKWGAFKFCSSLTSVTIPSSVASIESEAFSECSGLTLIRAKNATPSTITLESGVFYSVPKSLCILLVPKGSKSLYATADQWKDFENIIEDGPYVISATTSPKKGGAINGCGSYDYGVSCTLSATIPSGCLFVNWTEGGKEVSNNLTYTFVANADRSLVANFIDSNNFNARATNCSCRGSNDGQIEINSFLSLNCVIAITGNNYSKSDTFSGTTYNLSGLMPDTYQIVIGVNGLTGYQQIFTVVITQPEDLSVLKVSAAPNSAQYSVSGGSNYFVVVNDQTTENNDGYINVSLQPGENRIKIYTDKLCQGVYEETIYNDVSGQLSLFPNPTKGKITIGIPEEDKDVTIDLFSLNGQLLRKYKYQIPQSKLVDMDISDFANETYIVKVNGSVIHRSLRVVKQ